MKNLSPHREFKGSSTIKASLRPFYQHAWPKDLPIQCPICGTEFRAGWNLEVEPNRIGRFLRKAAYWSFLPSLSLVFVMLGLFPGLFYGLRGNHAWWLFFFLMFGPPPLLFMASVFMPIRRHVECKKCEWNHDYLPGKPTPIPPAKDSP